MKTDKRENVACLEASLLKYILTKCSSGAKYPFFSIPLTQTQIVWLLMCDNWDVWLCHFWLPCTCMGALG